jgi:putative FmdB family regulatory protein
MPIYEFVCEECKLEFEELVQPTRLLELMVCPACQGQHVKRKMSLFASKAAGGIDYGRSLSPAASCKTST